MTSQPDRKETLDISVLIATRDRARLLEETLKKIRQQKVEGLRWEVIVIDNGSVDETPSVLERARAEACVPLLTLHEPEPGKNAALNRGLEAARGRLLVFTDDDVSPSPRWIAELYRASREWREYNIFGGPINPIYPPDLPDWFNADRHYTAGAFARFRLKRPEGPLRYGVLPFGPNYAVRARVMAGMRYCQRIGPKGNEYAMGDETEMLHRLVAKGELAVYVPTASVGHHVERHQIEVQWLLRRAFRLGRGFARLENDQESVRIFGVPWYVWAKLPLVWTKYMVKRFSGPLARVDAGWPLYVCRGRIYEYRVLAKEPAEPRPEAVEAHKHPHPN